MASVYYVERGRRPNNCYDCDGLRACRCDVVKIRAVKRSARATWRERMREEQWEMPDDYYRDLAEGAFAVRSLFGEAAY